MCEHRIVDNLLSTEDSHYSELGQRRIKHNYVLTQSYARFVLFTMINTNPLYNMSSLTSIVSR